MTRYAVRHETRYAYGATVDLGLHLLRLTPLAVIGQRLLDYRLGIAPEPSRNVAFRDHFGNAVHHVAIEAGHDTFSVTLDADVDVARADPADLPEGEAWAQVAASIGADGFPARPEVAEFAYNSPQAGREPASTAFAAQSFAPGRGIVAGLRDLTARIRREFAYVPGSTDISTPVARVMETRRGVCQDFAHLMIAGLRGLGLPARYASGYIRTYPPADAAGLRGADASHAWVSAWCGEALGWVDFDPTNDLVVRDEHIVVAYGRDFSDVTPLRGVILGGGTHSLDVAVTVRPLDGG
ncbi:MAG: transglutaminase family protein [Alphaproteobacteria bacterium]|nr:transglutaminase family protein [Alphaproteobacteria bacterium]